MPPLSIPTRTFRLIPAKNYDGKITQAIPPPPPYHASVRNAIQRNEINQITTQIQQSCSTNVFNVSASTSSSTLTTNLNAINAESNAVYVNENLVKQLENSIDDARPSEQDESNAGELITSNEFENECEFNRGVDSDEHELDNHNETPSARIEISNDQQKEGEHNDANVSETTSEMSTKTSRNILKEEETVDCIAGDVDNANEKKTRGLKVLSNVQVSPNAILNVSLNSTNSETIPLNNMIIVSSIPSTSTGTTTQVVPTQLLRSQSLLKTLNESRSNPKHTKGDVEVSVTFINYSCA